MTIKFIYSVISLVLILFSPILFCVYAKHKTVDISVWDIVVGVVVGFLCKHVIVNYLISFLSKNKMYLSLISTTKGYLLIYVLLTSLCLFFGLLILNKFYYQDKYDLNNSYGLCIGMGIADILNTTLMAAVSNLVYIIQIQKGTLYSNLLNTVTANQANDIVSMYNNFPSSYFIYVGIITLALIASNYLISVLMLNMKTDGIKASITIIFTISLFTLVYYFTDPTKMTYANIILLVFMGMQILFAELNIRMIKIEVDGGAK